MKKFSDLKIGDKIYRLIPPGYIESHTILGISTLSLGELIFKTTEDYIIMVRKENIDKSISISGYYLTYMGSIITDPKIAKWFDL